jgi:hypothetical protein
MERARKYNTDIPMVLPHERVFPVQIGSQLFRLSGASISSDGKCLQDIFAMSPVFFWRKSLNVYLRWRNTAGKMTILSDFEEIC